MVKPLPPERPRSRRGGSLSPRGRGAQRRRHGPAGRRGSCQLDPSCERVGEWGAGQRERQEGATRSAPASAPQRLAAASWVSCPRALHSPRLSLRHRAPQRCLQVGALPAASERAPHSALYNPRPGRAGGGIGPPSARPSPPPGAPRPRPSPPPARRPPNRGGAAPLTWPWPQPPAFSHLPSRFTPPAVGCPGRRLPGRTVSIAPAILVRPSGPRLSLSRRFR